MPGEALTLFEGFGYTPAAMPLEPLFLRPSDVRARRGVGAEHRVEGRAAVRIAGHVDVAGLARIADPYEARGELTCDLEFAQRFAQVYTVVGTFNVRIAATCQRCLDGFDYQGAGEIDVGVVERPEDVPPGESADDFVVLGGQPLDVMRLVEDELLLALPMVPVHPGACPAKLVGATQAGEEAPAPSPFGILAGLRPGAGKTTDDNGQ